ncbi:MAG TPA: CbtA family protein [Nitrososphaeraceae archaeon]
MKTLTFLLITLLSGAIAGTILGIINQALVEPYIERAIAFEAQNAIKEGQIINPTELADYRIWQKSGEIAAATILGISTASLFGIVFAYGRSSLFPHFNSNTKKALVLAGIIWFVLFFIPAIKYPANPPAVGDSETIYYRESLYIGFVLISGFSALALWYVYKKLQNKNISTKAALAMLVLIYAAIITCAYLVLPANPDTITAPIDLVQGFRIATAFTMSIFWGLLGVIFGLFWDKFKPHETVEIATV